VKNDLDKFDNYLRNPQSCHITSFYAGGKKSNDVCLTEFEEGLLMEIEVKAILYVPGRIASGVCFPDPQRLRVKNQCPHLTLKVGSWAPVQSNSLLEAVFIDSDEQHPAPLSKEY
jgi:hypothetical protein